MTAEDNIKTTINTFCSHEQLKKFIGKICIWNFTFMKSAITGKLIDVTSDYMLIEMRDGRTMCAKLACINGFAMTKKQRVAAV
jgi:hypothetical protein